MRTLSRRSGGASLLSPVFAGIAFASASVLVAAPAVAASATDKQAAKSFHDGEKAFAAGDYRKAAEAFEAAYKAKPHHAPLWNAARSWEKAGEPVRAANLLEKYLQEAPAGARDRDQATAALADLEKRLGRLEVRASGVSNLRVDDAEPTGIKLYVTPGDHVVSGSADGKTVRKVLNVEPGQVVSVTLTPPKDEPIKEEPPKPKPKGGLSPWFVVGGAAATAVAGGLTVASGFDTVAKKEAFLGDATQPNLDSAFSAQTRTNVLLGVTVGLAVVTAVVAIFVDWKGKDKEAPPLDARAPFSRGFLWPPPPMVQR